jgi:tRNA U34 5-methylaminomethyl-2-thiouridine-forming methyltransferase MnmC
VFLNSGLRFFLDHNQREKVSVLEVGFGTGLNFLLSADFCTENCISLSYTGIEAHPLSTAMLQQTDYNQYIDSNLYRAFIALYEDSLKASTVLNPYTKLHVATCTLDEFTDEKKFDVLYFDAFAAVHQPEMWTYDSLEHCCSFLSSGSVFVTYAITGNLKRTMRALGFDIEKAPGAPGKREMLRAIKK